jgi:hypothetical protein
MLFFCMGLGLVASKTMYDIENNLLVSHGFSHVSILAQKT